MDELPDGMRNRKPCLISVVIFALASLLWAVLAMAENASRTYELGGYVAAELLYFPDDPLHEGQSDVDVVPSMALEPEFRAIWDGGRSQIVFTPFIRVSSDDYDPERNHADIRELNWAHFGSNWWTRVGVGIVYWGKLESRRIVDIINQRDLVDNVDPDDKLGQPMINLGRQFSWGSVEGYLMPYFREGTFPGLEGRLRGPFPVDTDQPQYESTLEERHTDVALRYSNVIGDYDFAASYFHGTGREPRVTLGKHAEGYDVLIPHYDIIDQVGLEVQATLDALLVKGEGYYRWNNGGDFPVFGVGFEYTYFSVWDTNGDIGVLCEYLHDGRGSLAPPTNFDDELFLGLRWTANDLDNTSFLGGGLFDLHTGSGVYSAEFTTRFGSNWKIDVKAQVFTNVSPTEAVLYAARKDHNLLVSLSRYF